MKTTGEDIFKALENADEHYIEECRQSGSGVKIKNIWTKWVKRMRPQAKLIGKITSLGISGFIMGFTSSAVQVYKAEFCIHFVK